MKAILVIDMPDNLENYLDKIKVFYAIGTLNGQELFHRFNQPLKPMPLKRETQVHWKSIGGGDIPTHEPSGEDIGWNKCVEYLEGDMQDD